MGGPNTRDLCFCFLGILAGMVLFAGAQGGVPHQADGNGQMQGKERIFALNIFNQKLDSGVYVCIENDADIAQVGGKEYYPRWMDMSEVHLSYGANSTTITLDRPLRWINISCTGSMQPMMGCENMVLHEELGPDDGVAVGDIVAYYKADDVLIEHQIIAYDETNDCYLFQGMNNGYVDGDCVARSEMKYRVAMALPTGLARTQGVSP